MQAKQFIEKIFLFYPLRGEEKKNQLFLLSEYEDSLGRLSIYDYESYWKQVREQFTYRPSIAELLKLCRKEKTFYSPTQNDSLSPFELARDDAMQFTREFLDNNVTAKLAKEEGWLPEFREIVYNIAWLQAQGIRSAVGRSWNGNLAYGDISAQGIKQMAAKFYEQGKSRGSIEIIFDEQQQAEIKEMRSLHLFMRSKKNKIQEAA